MLGITNTNLDTGMSRLRNLGESLSIAERNYAVLRYSDDGFKINRFPISIVTHFNQLHSALILKCVNTLDRGQIGGLNACHDSLGFSVPINNAALLHVVVAQIASIESAIAPRASIWSIINLRLVSC